MTKTHHAEAPPPAAADLRVARIRAALNDQCIVLVGMMGSGKSAIGQRLAHRLGLKFIDADTEIAAAARRQGCFMDRTPARMLPRSKQ